MVLVRRAAEFELLTLLLLDVLAATAAFLAARAAATEVDGRASPVVEAEEETEPGGGILGIVV